MCQNVYVNFVAVSIDCHGYCSWLMHYALKIPNCAIFVYSKVQKKARSALNDDSHRNLKSFVRFGPV